MKTITVNDLFEQCKLLINHGFGNKTILLSDDDEGNGFHTLYYTFTTNKEEIEMYAKNGLFHDDNDPNDVVILG